MKEGEALMRPASIVDFERFYLVAILLGLVNDYLDGSAIVERVEFVSAGQLGQGFAATTIVVGLALQLLLWYFVARRCRVVAKWIFVVLIASELLFYIWGVADGALLYGLQSGITSPLSFVVGLVGLLLKVAAVWMLFRPDARIWFGEEVPETQAP